MAEYEHRGTVHRGDQVIGDDGETYHLPTSRKRREERPLHSRQILFNTESTGAFRSDRVTTWEVVDPTPDLDASGEVVYIHINKVFLNVDGYEEDFKTYKSDIYGDVSLGDVVRFDWHTEGQRIWCAEVVEDEEA